MTMQAGTRRGLSVVQRRMLWGAIACLLAAPALAMRFTSEVKWGPGDFVVAAGLLGLTGLALEAVTRAIHKPARRLLAAGVVLAILLLVWAELAVGLFD